MHDHHPELKSDWLRRGDADLALAAVVSSAPARVVVASDFDGTLAEIAARPELAVPAAGALAVLRRLVESAARVLVISGREEPDLARLLPLPGLGLHGDFGLQQPTPAERAALADCERRLREEFGSDPRLLVETKRAALSLHYRSHPEMAAELLPRAVSLAAEHGLMATPGRAVVEIRPWRASKATALDALLQGLRPDAVVYAGDD
ncbi:MAG: trehalose-phosphatase, partial [Candidatus Dormibacteraceae bacterium]